MPPEERMVVSLFFGITGLARDASQKETGDLANCLPDTKGSVRG
jgi:hypothetical protein